MMDENAVQKKASSENVRLQNLRDFTVQIRHTKTDAIVGTGIIINSDGLIVTCAHVVDAAGVDYRFPKGKDIGIYFPQARGGEEKNYRALVENYFSDNDDDVVILKLKDGRSPLAPEQMPVLGTAELSEGNEFSSYGYRSLGSYPAGRADGIIMGLVERPDDLNLLTEPVQLKSQHIAEGMSGSGVLDRKRNLLIGIISETYFPRDKGPKDRDTAWAVDADAVGKLLTFEKISNVSFQEQPYPLRAAPQSKADEQTKRDVVKVARTTVEQQTPKEKYSWNSAPSVLTEWTGRDELLAQITEDWNNPQKHVTGLIGFGGEGKSSLARKWVETLNVERSTFDGLFWWGFYENRSIDEFLEAALNFLGGGKIDPRQVPSSSLRAQIIGAMLGAGRYLFVLDGLEVLQHQEGDQYGLLQSNDLRDLLTYFARPDNQSFCLITSRAPVLDLMEYTTYTHRDVDRLSEADGVALLKKLGVKPSPSGRGQGEGLAKVVSDWDGHALTISLLGSYLAEKYNGEITHLADIPIPTADEPRYERVHRVLRRYDEHLTQPEREFLKLFSAFRTPVHKSAFEKVFVPLLGNTVGTRYIAPIPELVNRLVAHKILRHDAASQTYTVHPLVRNHYFAILMHDIGSPDIHNKIKDYYLSIVGDPPQFPTLDGLKPFIEAVHHACAAKEYDEANEICWEKIYQQDRRVIANKLLAWETIYQLMTEFFLDNDMSKEPQVSDYGDRRWILNEVGLCLLNSGRLKEAIPFYQRPIEGYIAASDWHNASGCYRNLSSLSVLLGHLQESSIASHQSVMSSYRSENVRDEMNALAHQGRTSGLMGNIDFATRAFSSAESFAPSVLSVKYLCSNIGVFHADHLRRIGEIDYARRVTEANIEMLVSWNVNEDQVCQCYRVLGDLNTKKYVSDIAINYYETALKMHVIFQCGTS